MELCLTPPDNSPSSPLQGGTLFRSSSCVAPEDEQRDEVECVVSHFVVCGLEPGQLQPLVPVEEGCDEILMDVAVVLPSKGEEAPEGYTLIETTPDGQRASLNHGDVLGAPVLLAVRLERMSRCSRSPITSVQAIHTDRGEKPSAGFTAISRTVGGHEANLNYGGAGRDIVLCVERSDDKVPLCRLEVVVRSKNTLRVPSGCVLMRGDDGKPRNLNAGSLGSGVFLALEKALRLAWSGAGPIEGEPSEDPPGLPRGRGACQEPQVGSEQAAGSLNATEGPVEFPWAFVHRRGLALCTRLGRITCAIKVLRDGGRGVTYAREVLRDERGQRAGRKRAVCRTHPRGRGLRCV